MAGPQGQSALEVSREDLRRITAFGGLAAVEGQGIVLDVDGDLDAIALNDLLNELRNAGAEAMAVDDIRITHRSVAVQGPTSLLDRRASRSGSSFTPAGDRLAGGAAWPPSSGRAASSPSCSSSSTRRSWPANRPRSACPPRLSSLAPQVAQPVE